MKNLFLFSALFIFSFVTKAQSHNAVIGGDTTGIDYANPREYEIGGVIVTGADNTDPKIIKLISGLSEGDKIQVPGDKFSNAIENIWKQGLFNDVQIMASKIEGRTIFLNIVVTERPRLSKFKLLQIKNGEERSLKKSDEDDVREKVKLIKGKVVTDYLKKTTTTRIREHFINKGYRNCTATIIEKTDSSLKNSVVLYIYVNKGKKVKIKDVDITGNTNVPSWKLFRVMKDTKQQRWYNPFNSSKFLDDNYEKDRKSLIAKYNGKGYRDAKIVSDSVTYIYKNRSTSIRKAMRQTDQKKWYNAVFFSPKNLDATQKQKIMDHYELRGYTNIQFDAKKIHYHPKPNRVRIDIAINEGRKYYFRNVTWVGNAKYSSKELSSILGVKKGDIFDQEDLDAKLYMNPNGNDISSLYMDDGYLFFQIQPVEVLVDGDSIDMEMRIYEGKQAIINRITIVGNTKTNDRVIMREIRTKPGQLFRRSDIIRTQRELAQLGYFNAEKLVPTPTPHPAEGTVDIEYAVEEKPSDQVELSGGWGAGRIIGTLGVTFNNFSSRNIFKKESWRPLPSGDGQRLSIRAQSNGLYYQSYNASFTEPWLGGKKPNSLSLSVFHSVQSNGVKKWEKVDGEKKINPARSALLITGGSVGLGKRLKKPDDYFSVYHEFSYEHYTLKNFVGTFTFANGTSNNLSYKFALSRNSVDKPIFETRGSNISFSAKFTPPYHIFDGKDYTDPNMTQEQRFKWVEYQKYKFSFQWFTQLTNKRSTDGTEVRNLVLMTKAGFGFLGMYNKKVGLSPFERYYLGGSGLSGYALDGREIIALRGYDDQAVSPVGGAAYIAKYTAELRFPVTLNPQATIYALAFAEAGNSWLKARDFNPFDIKKSAGVGVRIFLPMFGLLGFDYGWGFDRVEGSPSTYINTTKPTGQFHFTIGAYLGEL